MNLVGIDLGTHKISVAAFVEGDSGLTLYDARTHDADPDAPRDQVLNELGRFARDLVHTYQPSSVWVEEVIIGNNRKYSLQLAEVKGAVLSTLAMHRRNTGVDIRMVDNKTWKREVIGNGNATKDQVKDYILVTHPAYAALCGDDQDCYDAACIGLYGFTVLERSTHLRL